MDLSRPAHPPAGTATGRRFAVCAVVGFALCAVGIVIKHTPVPEQDMWDGYLGFYFDVSDGDWGAWWRPHVDHRIVLTRLLMWLDIRFFGADSWLLVAGNFLALAAGWAELAWVSRRLAFDRQTTGASVAVSSMIALMLCSYVQQANIINGFQFQSLLAALLPLTAFVCLANSLQDGRVGERSSTAWYLLALLAGVASLGGMGNGILALPMMTAMALLARQRPARVAGLAGAALVCAVLYLHGFKGSAPGAVPDFVRHRLPDIVAFGLIFTGSALGRIVHSRLAAGAAGLAMVVLAIVVARDYALRRETRPLALAMAALIGFVAVSGMAAAVNRLVFGMSQAMNERYTTPSFYALSAALILVFARRPRERGVGRGAYAALALAAIVLMALQLRALGDRAFEKHRMAVAALAVAMPGNEPFVDDLLYPDPARLRTLGARALRQGIGIYGRPPYSEVAARIGHDRREFPSLVRCETRDVTWQPTAGDASRYLVAGALRDPPASAGQLWIADASGRLTGIALAGRPLPQGHDPWWSRRSRDGFDGFAVGHAEGDEFWCEQPSPPAPLPQAGEGSRSPPLPR